MFKKNIATWNKKKQKFSCEKTDVVVRAFKKIKLTIDYVYENLLIEDKIRKIKKAFDIPDNLCKNFNSKHQPDRIESLLAYTREEWEMTLRAKKQNANYDELNKNISERLDTLNPQYVNDQIWNSIVNAKIFDIPQEMVISAGNSLLSLNFPKVDNNLQIQVYPCTTESEYKFIWSEIIEKQKNTIPDAGKRRKFEYQMHDVDKKAYELKQSTKLTNEKIANEIKSLGIIPKNRTYTYIEVGKSIRNYKKFIQCSYS